MILARWRTIALIGAVIAALGASIWLHGMSTGKSIVRAEMVAALESQKQALMKTHSQQMTALAEKNRREREAESIKQIPRPVVVLCDAGDDWLQSINQAIGVSNSAAGTD